MRGTSVALLLATLLLTACNQPQATLGVDPVATLPSASQPALPQVAAGQVYEVKFRNIGTPSATSSVSAVPHGLSTQTLGDIDDTKLVFTPLTVDTFVNGGKRYIRAVYDVKNNMGASIQHLTFVPINTDPDPAATTPTATTPTVGASYYKSLLRFDGSDASSRAADLTPITGRIYSIASRQDVIDPDATPYTALDTSTLHPVAPAGLVIAGRANSGWRNSVPLANGDSATIAFAVVIANSSAQTDPFNFSLVVAEGDDVITPTVTSVSPNVGLITEGTRVDITGTGFTSDVTVKFGNVPASDVVVNSSTSLTVVSPVATKAGSVNVVVSRGSASSATGTADQFDYLAFEEYGIPTDRSQPIGITSGPDGNLWFTERSKIGRVTPSGVFSEFNIPTASSPVDITSGPDGNLWYGGTGIVGRITPNGTVTEFKPLTPRGYVTGITAGPDGNLWFTQNGGDYIDTNGINKIGRMTPTGTATEFNSSPSEVEPYSITSGPDGNLEFTESKSGFIGQITPSGNLGHYGRPGVGGYGMLRGITSGPDGNLWFTDVRNSRIGRLTLAGDVTFFDLPTSNGQPSVPQNITSGADGNLWFTESLGNKIGRITPSGSIIEFSIPTAAYPEDITSGPDGNLWFTESTGNKIGVLRR